MRSIADAPLQIRCQLSSIPSPHPLTGPSPLITTRRVMFVIRLRHEPAVSAYTVPEPRSRRAKPALALIPRQESIPASRLEAKKPATPVAGALLLYTM